MWFGVCGGGTISECVDLQEFALKGLDFGVSATSTGAPYILFSRLRLLF